MSEINQNLSIRVITIDGGAGTGKNSAGSKVATHYGYHYLDSGAYYRILGLEAQRLNVPNTDEQKLVSLLQTLDVVMKDGLIILNGVDQTASIKSDTAASFAKEIGRIKAVRDAFKPIQLGMRKAPGLVADGRDMGFIFETMYRFFLTASAAKRAERRVLEFTSRNREADYEQILQDIIERDISDQNNPVNKLRPHDHAYVIDTTDLTREQVADKIIDQCEYLDFVVA